MNSTRSLRWTLFALGLVALPGRSALAQDELDSDSPRRLVFTLHDGNFIVGFLYQRGDGDDDRGSPLTVAIHGASDTHTVFDFAPGYRAARLLSASTGAVLTLDRVGYGGSSRPSGDTLDFATS